MNRNIAIWKVRNLPNLMRGFPLLAANKLFNNVAPEARVYAKVIRAGGAIEDYGLISTRVVTDAGVQSIVDAFQGLFTLSNYKYHAMGTGGTAEAASQTALVTEVESRATGSQTENGVNVYRTVGTITATTTRAITEHGIFNQSAVGGTMLDRSLFSTINLSSGDSIQFTYDLTVNSGG
jgi:hypothetical protein